MSNKEKIVTIRMTKEMHKKLVRAMRVNGFNTLTEFIRHHMVNVTKGVCNGSRRSGDRRN